MTDTPELNDPAIEAYRDASYADAKGGGTLDAERDAAAVIRSYGDQRYQAAIDDVVEYLRLEGCMCSDACANDITRRFGKGQ